MGDSGWSFSRVKDVKEIKKQGSVVRKFLIQWIPTFATAAELNKTEKELLDMYVTFKVLGPVDIPENKGKDPKQMIWGVEETRLEDKSTRFRKMSFEELRVDHADELNDYLIQFVKL